MLSVLISATPGFPAESTFNGDPAKRKTRRLLLHRKLGRMPQEGNPLSSTQSGGLLSFDSNVVDFFCSNWDCFVFLLFSQTVPLMTINLCLPNLESKDLDADGF